MPQTCPALTPDEIRVRAWAEIRELLELQLAPLGRQALEALAAKSGERILDIGCGGGTTALELARTVAPDGTVMGIDLSAAMLAFAQRAADGCERVQFIQADAQLYPFKPASFDAAFSRFGIMFFADPVAAFSNIRRSLRASGRLAFVCWRTLEENALDHVPLQAASRHLPPQPDHDPDASGPFAFASADRVRGVLEKAGFARIAITAHDELVGSGDVDSMVAVCSKVGALGKILRENPELQTAIVPVLRSALARYDGPDGVKLTAATWIVTARAPAAL
jgi:SAM-dependent methyltransferase